MSRKDRFHAREVLHALDTNGDGEEHRGPNRKGVKGFKPAVFDFGGGFPSLVNFLDAPARCVALDDGDCVGEGFSFFVCKEKPVDRLNVTVQGWG